MAFGFWLLAFGFWLLAFGFWLLAFGFWAGLLTGCEWGGSHPSNAHLNEEDRTLKFKFRGMRGGELLIGALKELSAVLLYMPYGMTSAWGVFNDGASISSYGGSGPGDNLVMPKTLR